jgi:hypothetical protein
MLALGDVYEQRCINTHCLFWWCGKGMRNSGCALPLAVADLNHNLQSTASSQPVFLQSILMLSSYLACIPSEASQQIRAPKFCMPTLLVHSSYMPNPSSLSFTIPGALHTSQVSSLCVWVPHLYK